MKAINLYIPICIFLFFNLTFSQSETENYILIKKFKKSVEDPNNISPLDFKTEIQYLDGFGRPIQVISHKQSPTGHDIVRPISYDDFGRMSKEHLAYTSDYLPSLDFRENAVSQQEIYYMNHYGTSAAFAEKKFEDSPLNRILKQGAPGDDWQIDSNSDDHSIKFDYQTNTNTDKVRYFNVNFSAGNIEEPQLIDNGLYDKNQLYKTITKDENWQSNQQYFKENTSEKYVNMLGQVILKRSYDQNKWHDTYYVYDDYGNLTYVLPPKIDTYIDFWQTDASSQYIDVDIEDLYETSSILPHTSSSSISFDSSSKTMNFTGSAYMYSSTNMNVTFKEGYVLDLNLGVELDGLQLTGTLNKANSVSSQVSATVIGNKLHLNPGFGNVISGYYSFNLSASLVDYEITSQDLTSNDLNQTAYQYVYDSNNRLIEKKLPGKEVEFIIYDNHDRPVGFQDARLRAQNKWLFTKYDEYGRVAYTGIKYIDWSRQQAQNAVNGFSPNSTTRDDNGFVMNAITINYSQELGWPSHFQEVLTVNYYDDYSFMNEISDLNFSDSFGQNLTNDTKHLTTGSLVKVLGTNKWITSVIYYDDRARPIFVANENEYLNTLDIVKNKFDFEGKVLTVKSFHTKDMNQTITTLDEFNYDHAGRLLTQIQTVNDNNAELIVNNNYDELGQLVVKKVGGAADEIPENSEGLQTIDFRYNIRGWLTSINDPIEINNTNDLFGLGINYQNPSGPSTVSLQNEALYNGNISHILWKTDNINSEMRHYSYRYDALNRLKNSYYAENHKYNSKFNTSVFNYDRNGNILDLYRSQLDVNNPSYGTGMDMLSYTYDEGNKLLKVEDTGDNTMGFMDSNSLGNDYGYDENGNLLFDKNKEIINIEYNYLNLPKKIEFKTSDPTGKYIQYTYDASGRKQSKFVKFENSLSTGFTYYAGKYIYKRTVLNKRPVLKMILHPEGYLLPNNLGKFDYNYQYKDHLGNVRLIYSDKDNSGEITGHSQKLFYDDMENAGLTQSGWESTGSVYGSSAHFDTSKSLSGNYSAKIEKSISGGKYVHSNTWVPVNHNVDTDYIFSGWVYVKSEGSIWARLMLFMNENSETNYYTNISSTEKVNTKGKWIYVEKKVTVPANIDKINLRIGMYSNSGGAVWFDNLSIRKVNPESEMEIVQENNYYPFGLKHKGYNNVVDGTYYPYGYNGKEENDEHGLKWLDFGARNYEAALGRWMNLDPLAENGPDHSPFNFAFNNPIIYIDPDGRWPGYYGKYDLEWGGYMRDDWDTRYYEGQNYGGNGLGRPFDPTNENEVQHSKAMDFYYKTYHEGSDPLELDWIFVDIDESPKYKSIYPDFKPINQLSGYDHAIAELQLNIFGRRSETKDGVSYPVNAKGRVVGHPVMAFVVDLPFGPGSGLKAIKAAKSSTNVLTKSQILRIENAATRINKPISVVGSRASGKAGAFSDWDYVIHGGLKNSREWSKIKNSLPGARSILDNTPRNIDILPGPVWPGSPHITIFPR